MSPKQYFKMDPKEDPLDYVLIGFQIQLIQFKVFYNDSRNACGIPIILSPILIKVILHMVQMILKSFQNPLEIRGRA